MSPSKPPPPGPSLGVAMDRQPPIRLALPAAAINTRCAWCALIRTDPEAFHLVNFWLVSGEHRKHILAEARKRWGIRSSLSALYRHYQRHVLPWVAHTGFAIANLMAIQELLARTPDEDVTALLSKWVAMPLLQGLADMSPAEIAALPTTERIQLALAAARTLSQCRRAEAQLALARADIQLKLIRLQQSERDLILRAFQVLRRELEESAPRLLDDLQQVLDHIVVEDGEADVVAAEEVADNGG